MKTTLAQLLLAAALLAGGLLLLVRSDRVARLADAQRSLLTLRYDRAADEQATRAAAEYWRGNYEAVAAGADPLLAANAAYRAAVAPGGDARTMVGRLDRVIKQYADVVRNDPANEVAAFNYEFVVRYRAAIAARGVPVPPAADTNATPHGAVGGPPAGRDNRQFKVMVPMRPDERQEAQEAGRSGRRLRKG